MRNVNEKLVDYKNSIDKALAGYLYHKSIDELSEDDIKKSNAILKNISFEDYLELAANLDFENWKKVDEILTTYDIDKMKIESLVYPIEESEYLDKDLLKKNGFTHYGVFEDPAILEKLMKYLDENSIQYLQDSDGHVQFKFENRNQAYKVENAVNKIIRRYKNVCEELVDSKWYVVNLETKKILTQGYDSIVSARLKLKELSNKNSKIGKSLIVMSGKQFKDKGFKIEEGRRPYPWPKKRYSQFSKRRMPKMGKNMRKLQKKLGLLDSKVGIEQNITEGVLGMASVPSLNRLRELAGLGGISKEDISLPINYSDENLPMDDEPLEIDFKSDVGVEQNNGQYNYTDSDTLSEPGNSDMKTTTMPTAEESIDPLILIENALLTITSNVPYLRVVDYKQVVENLETTLSTIKSMGIQYLKEASEKESLNEWSNKVGGFKKTRIDNLLKKDK